MIRIAKTENGLVRGIEAADPRITSFKGIPFAAPPVGKNRWRAPQSAENWEGIRECSRFAPISMQSTPGLGTDVYCKEWHVDPEISMGEDCLYLNVWTGAKQPGEKQPVLVWFFGGGLQWGYPAEMEFDGERLARRGIVVVTVNYRINCFGFMTHPEIVAEAPDKPGNFGNLDQQAGLKWVIRNIEQFGGDPNNITIAGQSAGGGSVMAQMTSPQNFGLFQKAVVMSGMIRSPYEDGSFGAPEALETAQKRGVDFLEFLGVKTLEEARALDAFYIRDRYDEYMWKHGMMGPVLDGQFYVGDPVKLFADGKHADVHVMAGNTADEFLNVLAAGNEEELRKKVDAIYGSDAKALWDCPQIHIPVEGGFAPVSGIECTVKSVFLLNERENNDKKYYYYRFDADIPGEDHPGTFHSVDLWFFFETLAKCWRPFVGRHYDLSRQMCNYWVNFIKNGDPNGKDADGTDMPNWQPYKRECRSEMNFTSEGPRCDVNQESDFIKYLVKYEMQRFKGDDAS